MKKDSLISAPSKQHGANLGNGKLFLAACLVTSLVSASYADTTIPSPTRGDNAAYTFVDRTEPDNRMPIKIYNSETGATTATKSLDIKKTTSSDGTVTYSFAEDEKMGVTYTPYGEDPDDVTRLHSDAQSHDITVDPSSAVGPIPNPVPAYPSAGVRIRHTGESIDITSEQHEGKRPVFYQNQTTLNFTDLSESGHWNAELRGGVISNSGTIGNIIADFVENSANAVRVGDAGYPTAYGAAIYNSGQIDYIEGAFIKNYATNGGGAIYNIAGANIDEIVADFIGNSSGNGGAINNGGTIGSVTGSFVGNYVTGSNSGAIANSGIITNINADFIGNEANIGGAIGNSGTITNITGDFLGNVGIGYGGAISNTGTIDTITSNFTKNSSLADSSVYGGGAMYNNGTVNSITGNFTENVSEQSLGGAIFNDTAGTIVSLDGHFIDNSASGSGGAIYNKGTIGAYDAETGELDVIGGSFVGNTSTNGDGGAIYNSGTVYGFVGNFKENTANTSGGAIYNAGTIGLFDEETGEPIDAITVIGDFVDNSVTGENGKGGAIYNTGRISVLASDFAGNKATYGGALFNDSDGYIYTVVGDFTNNGDSNNIRGGAIDNRGTIDYLFSDFTNNKTNQSGGAISNGGTIGHIKGDFDHNASLGGPGSGGIGGGAILNTGTINSIESNFTNNDAGNGGAIYNMSNIGNINGNFDQNTALNGIGGGIYNTGAGHIDSITGDFTGNRAATGGAIYNTSTIGTQNSETGVLTGITGDFVGNKSGLGGAVYNTGRIYYVSGDFETNTSTTDGGAIYNNGILGAQDSATPAITGNFTGNYAAQNGGAIYNDTDGEIYGIKGNFTANYYDDGEEEIIPVDGGAVYNKGNISYIDGNFTNNKAQHFGGGIYNSSTGAINDVKGDFTGNTAQKGGAIYNDGGTINVANANFRNNTATSENSGGAIHNKQGTVVLDAKNSNMVIAGNTAGDTNVAIYNENGGTDDTKATVSLAANSGKTLSIRDEITGNGENGNGYNWVLINSGYPYRDSGIIDVGARISNQTIQLDDGTLKLQEDTLIDGNDLILNGGKIDMGNGSTGTATLNKITINGDTDIKVDVDYKAGTADRITTEDKSPDSYEFNDGKLHITDLNVVTEPTDGNVTIQFVDDDDPLKPHIVLDAVTLDREIMSPIGKYTASYDSDSGKMGLKRIGFNPAILASPVAAQLGGYLNALNSYEQAFNNLDMRMNYDNKTRNAFKYANKYADSSNNMVYSPTFLQEKNAGVWLRPYISYESVGLKNGPKVDNALYGSFFGGDSPVYSTKNGVDMQYSLYAGYTGSHQSYTDTGIYNNGGMLGATALLYKDNFFTALTLNAGASVGDASTKYGHEDFTMLNAGVASKTGYNIEFADGKFIVQPSILLSYTFVNTFDYTNAAGVKITSDPLHALNVSPGLKFIGNFGNGWQPYIGARMVWNIIDRTHFHANDIALSSLSVKPYVQYGLGIQKLWGERSTGFAQVMMRNGGRNGVAFNVGYRYALGK